MESICQRSNRGLIKNDEGLEGSGFWDLRHQPCTDIDKTHRYHIFLMILRSRISNEDIRGWNNGDGGYYFSGDLLVG